MSCPEVRQPHNEQDDSRTTMASLPPDFGRSNECCVVLRAGDIKNAEGIYFRYWNDDMPGK